MPVVMAGDYNVIPTPADAKRPEAWVEDALFLPVVTALGYDPLWFCILVAVNLQTAFLSPPVAIAAYYLKGVAPNLELWDIYAGMVQFMILQLIGLIFVLLFPQLSLWLPKAMFG